MGILGDIFAPMIASVNNSANRHNNEDTNRVNYQIAKEANELNWQINQQNLDYAREAWNKEVANEWAMWSAENAYNKEYNEYWYNMYNSPEAIVRQKREAGLNPYVSQGTGQGSSSSGPVGSMGSPGHNQPSMIPMQAVRMNPYYSEYSGAETLGSIAQMIGVFVNLKQQQVATHGMEIDNQYKSARNLLELANLVANNRNVNERTKGLILSNAFDGMSFNARLAQAQQQPELLKRQIRAVELENMCMEAKLPYISKYAQAELDNIVAQTENLNKKTDAEVAKLYSEAYLNNAKRLNLPNLSPSQRSELGRMMVLSARATAGLGQNELFWSNRERKIYKENSKDVPAWEKFMQQGEYVVGGFGRTIGGLGQFLRYWK